MKTRWLTLTLAALAGGALVAPPRAQAQTPQGWQSPSPTLQTPQVPTPPPRKDRWQVAAGGGALWVGSAGLDPFSNEDAVGRFSLSANGVVWRRDHVALAVGLGMDIGTTSARARGATSELRLTMVSATAEGRYLLAPRFYAFGRLAPGAQHGATRLNEPSAAGSTALIGSFTTAALAASAGAAFCLNGPLAAAGAWLIADGGYLLAPSRPLTLRPDLGDGEIAQLGTLDLGTIAPRGAFFRLSFALSY
jgi:hypothetical protein